MSEFNLMDDPWITVSRHGEPLSLPIRDCLKQAHTLDPWFGGEALFGAVAARLLTAFTMRLQPQIVDDDDYARDSAWETAVNTETGLDGHSVDAYCDRWRDSFWLVAPHRKRRFLQESSLGNHPDLPQLAKPVAQTKLTMHASPSYVWSNQDVGDSLPFDAAARHLLIFKHYAPSGIPDAIHPGHAKGTKWNQGRLRGRVSAHPTGDTLHATLLLHVLPPHSALVECRPPSLGRPR